MELCWKAGTVGVRADFEKELILLEGALEREVFVSFEVNAVCENVSNIVVVLTGFLMDAQA